MARIKALRDIELPFEEVDVSEDNTFAVRGIAFADLASLTHRFGPTVYLMFGKFVTDRKEADGGITPDIVKNFLEAGAETYPEMAHYIIALGAGDTSESALQNVARLRLPVQLDALDKIVGLTFVTEGDLKKAMEIVTKMLERVNGAISLAKAPASGSGIGAFASK